MLVSLFILFSPFVDDVPLSSPPPTPLCSRAHEKPIVVLCVYVGAVPYRLSTLRTLCGRLCAGSFIEPRIGMWWNPIVQRSSSSSSRQVRGFPVTYPVFTCAVSFVSMASSLQHHLGRYLLPSLRWDIISYSHNLIAVLLDGAELIMGL